MLRCLARDQSARSYPVFRRSCPTTFVGPGFPHSSAATCGLVR
jgi:hypothetical protein